jgi:uncharacterized protein
VADGAIEIWIKVTPKASKNRVGRPVLRPDGLSECRVYVTVAPDKNKANDAVIKLLTEHYGVSKSAVRIIRGHTSRHKLIRYINK